jgi:DNA-binding transcriptional MerR regulator
MSQEETFTISDLAREFGITPRAIRFYEDEGLLTPARAGHQRIYVKRDRTRLGLILRGKRLGLSLARSASCSACTTAHATRRPSCGVF